MDSAENPSGLVVREASDWSGVKRTLRCPIKARWWWRSSYTGGWANGNCEARKLRGVHGESMGSRILRDAVAPDLGF